MKTPNSEEKYSNRPLIKPSKEKILRVFESIAILVLIVEISSEKQISLPNKSFPNSQIAKETFEFMSIIKFTIKNEKFIQIPNKTNLIKKLKGDSV